VAIRKDISLLNPFVSTSSIERFIRELMFEPLLGMDQRGQIQPFLAESWEISADGKAYTFKLRQGVKFHNGQEMTSEDAKFAIDYTMNPRNGAYGFQVLSLVDRVETPDARTLRVHLKKVSASFLSGLTEISTFSVVPRGSVEEGIEKPGSFPPGTGPFKFVEWLPMQRIVLDRHGDYWDHKAHLDRVVFRPIEEDTVRITALRAGDVDFVERAAYEWVKEIQEGRVRGIGLAEVPYGGHRRIRFNVTDPPFDNKQLRLAVAHAIDRQQQLEAGFFGFGQTTDQRYPKGQIWHLEGLPTPAYDPDRARRLLQEAGYRGEPITMLVDKSPTNEAEAIAIQDQLKKVGLNVRLQVTESRTKEALTRRGDFAFETSGANLSLDPAVTYGPELACPPDPKTRTTNGTGYCDKEMDELLARLETELDAERRKGILRQALTRFVSEVPEIAVGWLPRYFAFKDYVKGFGSGGDDDFMWWGGGINYTWLDK
jgi:ABC-type transport system substrate-binding protein